MEKKSWVVLTEECGECGHTHQENQNCKCAFCDKCGLGGDLTSMSCETSVSVHEKIRLSITKRMGKQK